MPKFKIVYRRLVDYYFFVDAEMPSDVVKIVNNMDIDEIPVENYHYIEDDGIEEIVYIDALGNEWTVDPSKERPDLTGKRVVAVRDVLYADHDTGVNIELSRGDRGTVIRSILLPDGDFDEEPLPVYIVTTDGGLEVQCWYDEIEVIE